MSNKKSDSSAILRRWGKNEILLKIKIKRELASRMLADVELDGIDHNDAPDYVDAFVSSASWIDGTRLTDDEIDQLNEDSGLVYALLMDYLY